MTTRDRVVTGGVALGARAGRLNSFLSATGKNVEQLMPPWGEAIWHEFIKITEELFLQNDEQWRLEDIAHTKGIRVDKLGETKRLIDQSNSLRIGRIDQIDQLIAQLANEQTGRRPHVHLSETVGEMIDRICILLLKVEGAVDPEARDLAERKFKHLTRSLDLTLFAILEGRAVLPPSGNFKIYRPLKGESDD
ncbi:DUF4254 domain-containing protein [Streptomyces sp. NRRL S-1824]|uniref:DUF4254 domain-containing protein n=1 Tax=Streptomyces sp. NRRL S-1824 TaxID=1463889 RepID=UPI00131BF8E8|nr:DUF4254 domain-containing protein [Streptomyces sp. NRRL S-1824]